MTARVHEDDAKRLLAAAGVAVPAGEAAVSPDAARAAAARLGGKVVVKALVLANRRGKSGGVIFADTPADAGRAAATIFGRTVAGLNPEAVLVEERLDLERELFLSFVLDSGRRRAVALASLAGGVDVESATGAGGTGLHRLELDPCHRDLPHRFRHLWSKVGLRGATLLSVAELSARAAAVFRACEAEILELNPLGCVGSRPVAVGAVVGSDDQARARHRDLAGDAKGGGGACGAPTVLEREARAVAAAAPYRGTTPLIELG